MVSLANIYGQNDELEKAKALLERAADLGSEEAQMIIQSF
jgi:TPR repeat protein